MEETKRVTIHEFGPWIEWEEFAGNGLDHKYGQSNKVVHAIQFADGSIWDAGNGWRKEIAGLQTVQADIDARYAKAESEYIVAKTEAERMRADMQKGVRDASKDPAWTECELTLLRVIERLMK
jgi:hypothetical protein